MMKDIAIFDTMYDKNLQYFKELSLYIIAGEKKLEELKQLHYQNYKNSRRNKRTNRCTSCK